MISVLDGFVAPGSELWLFSNVPLEDRRDILLRVRLGKGRACKLHGSLLKTPSLSVSLSPPPPTVAHADVPSRAYQSMYLCGIGYRV